MYIEYFVNMETGELFISNQPKDNKIESINGWKRINSSEFELFRKVILFAQGI